jgi:hypothetical protein
MLSLYSSDDPCGRHREAGRREPVRPFLSDFPNRDPREVTSTTLNKITKALGVPVTELIEDVPIRSNVI